MVPASMETVTPLIVTLANGLRIVATPLPGSHRVACSVHLRIGSRYETEEQNGLSHFLEHMLYRGVPGHGTAHEQALAFESLGGTLTAATGPDSGTLAVACPEENFDRALGLLASVYKDPLFTGLAVEKRIVREEILEDLDESGAVVDDYVLLRAAAFGEHPLGFPVTGTAAHLDRFTEADLRRHHAAHYVGKGTVISVAGPIDPSRVVRLVEALFGDVPAGAALPLAPPPAPAGPRTVFVESSSSQSAICVGFRAPGLDRPEHAATDAIVRLLDDGNATRLYARLGDELGLVYDVSAGYEVAEDAGLVDVGCDAAHREAPRVLTEILGVLCRLRDEGPDERELARLKERHRWSLEEMLDSPTQVAEFFADATLRGYARSLVERQEAMAGVTRDAVMRASAALFQPRNLSAVIVGPRTRGTRAALADIVKGFA